MSKQFFYNRIATVRDQPFYDQCIQRMEQYKISDKSSEILGAFGNAETGDAYSLDQLSALLAYDAEKVFHKSYSVLSPDFPSN